MALVGVGNLGVAFLSYDGFARYGLEIIAAFDSDAKKVGKKIGGIVVEPVKKLASLTKRSINLAIVAVPPGVAQDVADVLVKSGVKGILNFSACSLTVPKRVRVTNIDIGMDLASLPYYLPSS